MISLAMLKPKPEPIQFKFLDESNLKKGLKISFLFFSGIPGPSSSIFIKILFPTFTTKIFIFSPNLQALLRIFEHTLNKSFSRILILIL